MTTKRASVGCLERTQSTRQTNLAISVALAFAFIAFCFVSENPTAKYENESFASNCHEGLLQTGFQC